MLSPYKIALLVHIIFNITRYSYNIVGKIGAKHISCAENSPTAHTYNNPTIDINSQHPYLLGFDSNLILNLNILAFQPYLGEDSEDSEESGRFACISASPLGNTPNIREIHFDWSYFLQDTVGFIANTEYIDYSLDSERKTRIIWKIMVLFFYRIQQGLLQTPNTLIIRWIRKELPE